MDLKILNQDNNILKFQVNGISPAIANTIRRLVVNHVPTLAIEDVEINKNVSALYDEMLAHRLGLIPLKTDLKSYTQMSECKCKGEGCSQCQLKLTLKVKGPKIVCAEDLISQDPKVEPIHKKMVIVKLLEDQELELIATAILGQGKDHMKFSPGLLYYQGYPDFNIKDMENSEEVAKSCPVNILEASGKKVKVTEKAECILCNECVYLSEGKISIKASETDFILTLESWGQLEPKEILTEALSLYNNKLDQLSKSVKKLK